MSLPVLPNPSNLVAVALVVNRTRDGANLVFHYPPEASVDHVASPPGSPEGDLGQNDMILERLSQNQSKSQGGGFHAGRGLDGRFAPTAVSGAAAPWETVTGFPASDLATLLSPGPTTRRSSRCRSTRCTTFRAPFTCRRTASGKGSQAGSSPRARWARR